MAFTGKKHKGSRILTPETVENRKMFYKSMKEIEEVNPNKYNELVAQMFWEMFNHLSHSSQKELIECADHANWNTVVMGK